jgi:competence protein ComEC
MPRDEKNLNFKHYYKAEAYISKAEKPYSDFQFDYGKYLARKGIYFQSYLPNSYRETEMNDLTFSEKIRQKRLETLQKIDHADLSKNTREFTKGIILADRTEMDKETVQDFSKSGLMHIMAISGSHMAIIFWLILLILNPVFPPKYRNFKIIISLALIWAFAIFIDYGSSVVRSCIMISCYYIYVLLQRKTDLLHSMAVAAFVILIVDTNQLFDVGFQLSFTAVFGIFWFNQPVLKYLPKPKNKFQNFMANAVSISIAAQIATLPLVIYYFHQWGFISIIANMVIIPFSEILIVFALLMTVLIEFSIQFSWLNTIYDYCVRWTLKSVHFFADTDFAFHKMIPMILLEVGVIFIGFKYS